jgi:AcrR family transcriptional regulator
MKKTRKKPEVRKETLDLSTEEKIRLAALKIFTKKGFSGTRTRDIAEEAKINLALLNYYFRSKEKLFELLMTEILQNFFKGISQIFNEQHTSVDEKVVVFVNAYTALLKKQPDLPLFIFHELKLDPQRLASKMGAKVVFESFFFQQIRQEMEQGKIRKIHPLHYIINMIGMCVFPFIASPILKHLAGMDEKAYALLIEERNTLVPQWMKLIMHHS